MNEIMGTGLIRGKRYTAEKPYRVNLTPVENLIGSLEEALNREENRKERKSIKLTTYFLNAVQKMNREQLKYLIPTLIGIAERWAFLYQSTLDNPEEHLKFIRDYRKLQNMAKKALRL